MGIPFSTIPTALRVPFFAAEFNSSAAQQGPALLAYRALIIGQKTSGGSGAANSFHLVTSPDDVVALAGRGSMLHRQSIAWFKNNQFTETWIGILADNGAGVAATGTLAFTGPATAAGTLSLYLGGNLISVAVANGDSATTIGTNVAAAINAAADLPVTASAASGTVTVTFRHKGAAGNDFDMRANYQPTGEALPAGVGLTVTGMASGATNPVLTTLIANMGDTWYQVWAHPYYDATSLTAIEAELLSRFGGMRMIDGIAITSAPGSVSTLGTLGLTRNSAQSVIVAQAGDSPLTPPMEFAAAVAGLVAFYGNNDPARPFQTLQLTGCLAPADPHIFTLTERNLLLFDGIATTKTGAGGVVQLERMITTYRINAAGSPDTAYLDVTTLLTLLYLRYSWRARLATNYPRHKLADDGATFGPGQAVITPKVGKAEAIAWFNDMATLGLVENADDFKANVVCARSTLDPNRLEWLLPPNIINGLVVGASSIQFRL